MVFADIAACRAVRQGDAEAYAARHHGDLARRDVQPAELGVQRQSPVLRNDQQFAVGVPENALHCVIGAVNMHGDAGVGGRLAICQQRHQTGDEIGRRVR